MANTPRWKGSNALTESPTSPLFEATREGPRYTRTFRGPYAKCVSDKPARLSAMAGTPAGFTVDSVRIAKQPGATAEMTVVLTPSPVKDYTFDGNEVLEVEWCELQKRLEEHPIYKPGGAQEITRPGRAEVEEWKNAATKTEKESVYSTLTDACKHLVDRLARGQDSYQVYFPIARRTTKHASPPTVTAGGKRQNPPAAIKVAGYEYLKTADRLTKNRTWTRVEEWTGAEEVDEDIYEEA